MNNRWPLRPSAVQQLSLVVLSALVVGWWATAYAQYSTTYPYSRASTPVQPRSYSAMGVGGFNGNPYTRSPVAPTGLPVSANRTSYYGGSGTGRSMGYRPQKPFSNMHTPRPLISGTDAARIEIARGLWHY